MLDVTLQIYFSQLWLKVCPMVPPGISKQVLQSIPLLHSHLPKLFDPSTVYQGSSSNLSYLVYVTFWSMFQPPKKTKH